MRGGAGYHPAMPSARPRSAAEILRSVSPRDRAALLRAGLDPDDTADAELFVMGVRAADASIAEQERWERERLR